MCSDDRRDRRRRAPTARSATRGVNGRPALGISALPGSVGEDRLVVGQRPARGHVARSGSARRGGRGRRAAARGSSRRGEPQARAGQRTGAASVARRAAGQRRAARRRAAAERLAPPRAQLDDPARVAAPGSGGREVELDAVPSARRAGSAAGSVADVLTTSRSPAPGGRGGRGSGRGRARPSRARRPAAARRRAQPARLGRLVGLEGSAAARRRAARSGRRPQVARAVAAAGQVALDQREQPGHAVLGRRAVGDVLAGERSWCMRVLMSPGSTA